MQASGILGVEGAEGRGAERIDHGDRGDSVRVVRVSVVVRVDWRSDPGVRGGSGEVAMVLVDRGSRGGVWLGGIWNCLHIGTVVGLFVRGLRVVEDPFFKGLLVVVGDRKVSSSSGSRVLVLDLLLNREVIRGDDLRRERSCGGSGSCAGKRDKGLQSPGLCQSVEWSLGRIILIVALLVGPGAPCGILEIQDRELRILLTDFDEVTPPAAESEGREVKGGGGGGGGSCRTC
jgi:hypothetical protein